MWPRPQAPRRTRLQTKTLPLHGGIADNHAVHPARPDCRCNILQLGLVEVGRDLDRNLGLEARVDVQAVALRDDLAEEARQKYLSLQAAQAGRVGRRHVDDEHVGIWSEHAHAREVVVVDVGRRRLVLAEVDPQQAAFAERAREADRRERVQEIDLGVGERVGEREVPDARLEPVQRLPVAERVEAVAVDCGAVFFEAEEAGAGVAGLGVEGK